MGRLSGRTVLVTGGAQGIGAAVATALARDGAYVAIADLRVPERTVAAIREAGGAVFGGVCDVADPESVSRLVGEVLDRRDGIHGLVTNAALFTGLQPRPFETIPSEEFERVLTVNVRGTFEVIRAVAPVMRRQRDGSIVTVSSGTVFKGIPMWAHYVSSKGAVIAMTRALARELGPDGVRVNCVAPGFTLSEGVLDHSESFPRGLMDANVASRCLPREQTPDDLTGVMSFLLSGDSGFVTGQTVVVDGGSVLR
ncbi:SDR family NAD(P)-dependent oxidoreductase [Pseudonocardia zijingensis]|jgi:NAD(P)-dependent dehydrogenase (short-subunit alcohol dehydrogenase family)|uniref:3-oxoacyl-ACP reductase FabG n=1 Tax=Pseudonocardia zijingensis TaxID=153376 RepID=A0ABN1N765_9PSEU